MGLGHDPEGKTLGILGMGGIGSAVARRALAFDFKIQYHNRHPLPPDQNPFGATYVDFETLLRTSDAISVHLPLGEGTRGLIGKREFTMMKEGVVIVNTARGPIIDEEALVEAVESGKVFGAGLDVYEREPEVSEGLVDNENVILLPHVGTATYETQVRIFFRIPSRDSEWCQQLSPIFSLSSTNTGFGGACRHSLSSSFLLFFSRDKPFSPRIVRLT